MNVSTEENKTVVGMFNDLGTAHQAAERLEAAGITRSNISVIAGNESGKYTDYASGAGEVGKGVAGGAGTGAAIGGGLGLLAGLTALAIPGFGPIIAAGPIAAALTGAGIGAASGGLIGGLTHAGIPEDDATAYAEGVKRGGALVTVRTSDALADEASDILDGAGAYDVDEESRSSAPSVPASRPAMGDHQHAKSTDSHQTIPIVQENLQVGKRSVQKGGVRVYSEVSERPVEENVTLRHEKVNVERRAVDRPANEADFNAFKEGTIELRETREEAVVNKQARVVEEVVIGKHVHEHQETVKDTVRRTDVRVEDLGATDYDTDYRADFSTRYANRGLSYDTYAPAYQFGNTYANDTRYAGREWNEVESDLRNDWSSRGHGKWEDFEDSVRYGWDKIRGKR